jgi:hypothetical protein
MKTKDRHTHRLVLPDLRYTFVKKEGKKERTKEREREITKERKKLTKKERD